MSGKWSSLIEVCIAGAGMCLFALLVHSSPPLVFMSILGILTTAIMIYRFFSDEVAPVRVLGLSLPSRKAAGYTLLGIILGMGLGVIYRIQGEWGLFPETLTRFAAVAALIGGTEEIVYRGYVQGRARRLGAVSAVFLGAFCHTLYKYSLFIFSPHSMDTNFLMILSCTFIGGLVFGAMREYSGNILPPLTAHVLFDIIVYGDHLEAPWWVWS